MSELASESAGTTREADAIDEGGRTRESIKGQLSRPRVGPPKEIACTMAVIGGGTMGIGIAYAFATAGWRTTVVETDATRSAALVSAIRERAETGVARGRLAREP